MKRSSIFQTLGESENINVEAGRIDEMFTEKSIIPDPRYYLRDRKYSLCDFVDQFCFAQWKGKGHCVDVQDFLTTLDYDGLINDLCIEADNYPIEEFFSLIEIVYNFWMIAYKWMLYNNYVYAVPHVLDDFYHLRTIMDEDLSHFNHKAVSNDENERTIIIEDKPEVSAVAEIVESEFSWEILRYNHYLLRGDLKTKKSILLCMGNELEPKKKKIECVDRKLCSDIFFMLNNMNLRHNNCNSNDHNKFNKIVEQMEDDELENWYDELYQMILLALLELEQQERFTKVSELKTLISEAKE